MRTVVARALCLAAAAATGPLAAQDGDRVGVAVGEANAYPEVRIDYLSNDNVFVQADDPVDGSSVVVSPSVELVADRRLLTLRATYAGRFSQGSEDVLDYADHTLSVVGDAALDKRNRFTGSVTYARGHQEVGFNLTRGRAVDLNEAVVFNRFSAAAAYRYGVVDARGNVEVGIDVTRRNYANLEAITEGRDFTAVQPFGLFSYRLSGDTRALVELRYGSFSVDNGVNDRGELSLFGGAEFAATGRIRGGFRLGATQADYSDASREDVTLLAASADVSYLLREYSTLRLNVDRELDDSAVQLNGGTSAQAITDSLRLTWLHEWTSRVSHRAYVERSSVVQLCPDGDSSTVSASLELNFLVRRWLSFGAGASGERRDGEACADGDIEDALDYERRVLGVHVRATL